MHISEGVLSAPVLLTGAVLSLGGLIIGLRSIKQEDTPKAAILSAVFFVASLIHVNIGPSSTHLVLSGIIGLMMGWAAFPVIFFGLLLQGILFGFGGISTLGVNTFTMAAPSALFGLLFRKGVNNKSLSIASASGFVCGSLPILVSAILVAVALRTTGEEFTASAWAVIILNLPIFVIEGFVTMFCVQFIRKVRPELLENYALDAGKDDKVATAGNVST
ncbi:MAG: cobalt transporter CbiM [Deltaproteobacteria bacterium]|jgi:cobalt/nickel transport system permease protein|nr:cobalt transporter CbiM [Deltaproteobacteria bacterium]